MKPQEQTNGDRKTQEKKRWIRGNGFGSLVRFSSTKSTSLHSSWIRKKIKDYGIQHHNSDIGGHLLPCIPLPPVGSPHNVVLLQGSVKPCPLAPLGSVLDDAKPHTFHPLTHQTMLKYAIMQYTPQRYMRRADFDTQEDMRHLLDFKAGRRYATKWAADLVARTLAPMDLTDTIIVCIPASSC